MNFFNFKETQVTEMTIERQNLRDIAQICVRICIYIKKKKKKKKESERPRLFEMHEVYISGTVTRAKPTDNTSRRLFASAQLMSANESDVNRPHCSLSRALRLAGIISRREEKQRQGTRADSWRNER